MADENADLDGCFLPVGRRFQVAHLKTVDDAVYDYHPSGSNFSAQANCRPIRAFRQNSGFSSESGLSVDGVLT